MKFRFLTGAFSALLVILSTSLSAFALQGKIHFTQEEKARHLSALPLIMETTAKSMQDFARDHFAAIDQCGIGLLYGFKSAYAKLPNEKAKTDWLQAHATCNQPPTPADVSITSCEIHTNRHLAKGFAAAGQSDLFQRITAFFKLNDRSGIALAYALRELGWKVVYWNTDVAVKHPTPQDRHKMGATPEDHVLSYAIARRRGTYYEVPVDGWLINFAPSKGSKTQADIRALTAVKAAPYFIGVAHGGFHVFPGTYGTIIESHSPYNPDRAQNIEVGEFNPPFGSPNGLTVTVDGRRQMVHYHSGIIAVPPGDWLWF